jgi:methyl-accepting chemotaxis protein
MESKPKLLAYGQRRFFLINRSLQFKVIFWVMFAVLLALLIIGYDLYQTFGRDVVQELMDPGLTVIFKHLVWVILIKMGVYMVAVAFLALYLSNKFAGPAYRIEKSAQLVGEGDLTHRARLRKGDEFLDLQDAFNVMVQSLQEKASKEAGLADRIGKQLEDLSRQPGLSPEVLQRIQGMKAEVSHIGSSFKV